MPNEKKKEIKTDEIVDRILRQEGSAGVIKLVGRFLGNSHREDQYRLYLTEELDHYLEFPKQAAVDTERFPSGRLVVWIKAGTQVQDVFAKTRAADFLRGDLGRTNAQRAVTSGVRGAMMLAEAAASGCGSCSGDPECDTGPACW